MKKYKMYIELCKQNKAIIATGLSLLVLQGVLAVKMPFMMNDVLDDLFTISKSNYKDFIFGFSVYSVLFIVQMLSSFASTMLFKRLGIRNSKVITSTLMKKIFYSVKQEPPQFSIGNAMQIMSSDAFNLGENGILIIYRILQTAINIGAVFYYMWHGFPPLAIIITLEFILIMIVQKKLLDIINRKIMENREIRGKYSFLVNDFITDHFNYRRLHCFEFFSRKYKKGTEDLLENGYSLEKTLFINGLLGGTITILNFILIFGIGSYQLFHHAITVSTLVTFNMYSTQFGSHITSIPDIAKSAKEFSVSYERVMKMYNIHCYTDTAESGEYHGLTVPIESIELDDVSFTYNTNIPPVFNDISFEFKKGNIYCFRGSNGCGKSTLLSLITGEYPLSAGRSLINGDKCDLYTENIDLNEHISFSSASITLFSDSIKNNLLLSRNMDSDIQNKINRLYSLFDISSCTELALDSAINERKNNLSDGQKQKLTLIRTLIDDREIMIFDEPEKHLDNRSKYEFMNYLNTIKTEKIIIIVSHEKEIQEMCDCIINVDMYNRRNI